MEERNQERRALRLPTSTARLRIRPPLRAVPKAVAARHFQLLSGHAMIAPLSRERWGLVDRDTCWWCEKADKAVKISLQSAYMDRRDFQSIMERGRRGIWRESRWRGTYLKSRKGFGYHVRQASARPRNTAIRNLLPDARCEAYVSAATRVVMMREGVLSREVRIVDRHFLFPFSSSLSLSFSFFSAVG